MIPYFLTGGGEFLLCHDTILSISCRGTPYFIFDYRSVLGINKWKGENKTERRKELRRRHLSYGSNLIKMFLELESTM